MCSPGANAVFATSSYRFGYQSLTQPASVWDEDLATGERTLRKRQPVLDGFDPDHYRSAREWAPAPDGTLVPISLVWRPDAVPATGPAPCVLYGYGAYEASMDPWFSIARLSLLDQGVVFAVAHVRGGGELGRRWYEDGKFGAKANTFTDFVACGRHLVATGRTAPEVLAARGGSAGGLLVGAVTNLAPDLFRAVIGEVPFVDPLATMLDPSLPLTVNVANVVGSPPTVSVQASPIPGGFGLQTASTVNFLANAVATGGIYQMKDSRVNPDTVNAVLQYAGGANGPWNLTFESSVLPIRNDRPGVFFQGTEGSLELTRAEYVFTPNIGTPQVVKAEGSLEVAHAANFLDAVKSGKRPSAGVQTGIEACNPVHLAKAAYWKKRRMKFDSTGGKIVEDV